MISLITFISKISLILNIIALSENYVSAERVKRAIEVKKNPNYTVPIKYYVGTEFEDKQNIYSAIRHLWHYTCLEFTENDNVLDAGGINFVHTSKDNRVYLEPDRKNSFVTINNDCLANLGCVKHHLGLALGLHYEVNRYDRDKYVKMFPNNLLPDGKKFYRRDGASTRIFNTAFDFGSIMMPQISHLAKPNKRAFRSNVEREYENMIGQRAEYSHNDLKLINDFYCGKRCGKKVKGCKNGGYPNPDCGNCVCPAGYTGKTCSLIKKGFGKCGKRVLTAKRQNQTLELSGIAKCYIAIYSKPRTKIAITVVKGKTEKSTPCIEGKGLEIKYRHDKGATGLCLCGEYNDVKIIPTFSQALIIYKGENEDDHVKIIYRESRR